ncbi:peptide/nickel transport system substrate-binding protein [Spinactinospora alkalitolerans]|uniref:Peptide/nickel transport system substrate-binding protein n=1 Tax=Spinactinospora alkalitolerans TaxID=687207 RepID=A0A852TXT5_9ACTN|nr:ABC transporter substrate-binding protein [Spinactinospora alkalitolerans]NYE48809.1 peptide/nickel transport system substrate-binding protein [Spinactinospora alkalitolerans]
MPVADAPATRARPRSTRLRAVAAVAAALALSAAGCSSGGYDQGSAGSSTFTYLTPTDVITEWDPAASYSNELAAFPNMYETLTRYDPETEQVEPLLATEWSGSEDGLTWSFTLRDDVTFHSGAPMTAASVKEAVERTIELDSGAAYLWAPVEGIEATGEHTVTFTLAYPAALDLISSAAYAAYVYEVPDDAEDFEATSFGTGPYTVESWSPGSENELNLTRFDDYWGGWEGAHYDSVSYRVAPQASTAAQLMTSGEAHYAQLLPSQLLEPMRDDPALEVTETTSWQNLFGLMNTEKAPLDDARVRRAVAHAVDYEELVEGTDGSFTESDGVVPEGLLGHQEDPELRGHDPERAEELLEEAGYGPGGDEGPSLDLTYTEGDEEVATMVSLMQSQLAEVGIELNVEALPWESAQWPRAQEEDPQDRQDILLMYWWPDDPQPLSWYQNMFRSEDEIVFNLAYYSDPELDGLIDEVGSVTATDEEAAAQMYADMQEVLVEDAPSLFLGTRVYQRALSSDVEGFRDNPMYANVAFVHDYAPAG